MYAGTRPMFVEVDEVTFKSPVDVGDLLRLSSVVLMSHPDPADASRVSAGLFSRLISPTVTLSVLLLSTTLGVTS